MGRERLGKQKVICDWCKGYSWKNVGTEWSGHAILACKTPGCGHEWVETTIVNGPSRFLEKILNPEEINKIMLEISQGWPHSKN